MTDTPKPPVLTGDTGLQLQDLDQMWRFASIVKAAGLAPKGMDKQEQIFIAVQIGAELGLPPMQAVQGIAVVNGRPSVWGDTATALITPLLQDAPIETECGTFPNDDYGWTVKLTRKGYSAPVVATFTVGDAKTAGLWQFPAKGQTPWHKYPKDMLLWRARSRAYKAGFSDALKGVGQILSREEVEYAMKAPPRDVTPPEDAVKSLDDLAAKHAPSAPADDMPVGGNGGAPESQTAPVDSGADSSDPWDAINALTDEHGPELFQDVLKEVAPGATGAKDLKPGQLEEIRKGMVALVGSGEQGEML